MISLCSVKTTQAFSKMLRSTENGHMKGNDAKVRELFITVQFKRKKAPQELVHKVSSHRLLQKIKTQSLTSILTELKVTADNSRQITNIISLITRGNNVN